jgi:hypothetical protein
LILRDCSLGVFIHANFPTLTKVNQIISTYRGVQDRGER